MANAKLQTILPSVDFYSHFRFRLPLGQIHRALLHCAEENLVVIAAASCWPGVNLHVRLCVQLN